MRKNDGSCLGLNPRPQYFSSCVWCFYDSSCICLSDTHQNCCSNLHSLPCPDLHVRNTLWPTAIGLTSVWLYSKSMPCTALVCILDARKFLACDVWFLFECLLQVPCELQNRDCASQLLVHELALFHGNVRNYNQEMQFGI